MVVVAGAHSVSITDLRVPALVKNGTNNAAILDCQYSLRPEEQLLSSGQVVFQQKPESVLSMDSQPEAPRSGCAERPLVARVQGVR